MKRTRAKIPTTPTSPQTTAGGAGASTPDPDASSPTDANPRGTRPAVLRPLRPNRDPRFWGPLALLLLTAGILWNSRLMAEPRFVDESAYLAQSFYWDLFRNGQWDAPAWLLYEARDLPPLPKYLFGFVLEIGGEPRPSLIDSRRWYANTATEIGSPSALLRARRAVMIIALAGLAGVALIGWITVDRRLGLAAGLLLMINPLYALHACRAMSDIPAETGILFTVFFGFAAWNALTSERSALRMWTRLALAGVAAGCAVAAKLNGGLGLMTLVALGLLTLTWPGIPWMRKIGWQGGLATTGATAFLTFFLLNPYLSAHPKTPAPGGLSYESPTDAGVGSRVLSVIQHRRDVSQSAKLQFPHNALNTPVAKAVTAIVQGLGRFGPLGPKVSDSRIWLDPRQDGGALLWGPMVLLGILRFLRDGLRQYRAGEPPRSWVPLVYIFVAAAVVTAFLPLAWDRYLMSLQPPTTLAGAYGLITFLEWGFGSLSHGTKA